MEQEFVGIRGGDQLYASRHSIVAHGEGEHQGGEAEEVGRGDGADGFEDVHGGLAVRIGVGAEGRGEEDGTGGEPFEEGGAEAVARGEDGGEAGGVDGFAGEAHQFEASPRALVFPVVEEGAEGLGDEIDK